MKVKLGKRELIDLVKGVSPNYSLFENPVIKLCGRFNGSYGTWYWELHELEKLNESELYSLYDICKKSWY